MAKVTKRSPTAAPGTEYCIYLGPTIIGVVQQGTVFPMPKDKAVASIPRIAEYPEIASLVFSGAELPKARISVRTHGTLAHHNYTKLTSRQH